MSFLVHARKNRTADFVVSLFEADGTTEVVLAAEDVVRVKIGRGDSTPTLDLSSAPDEHTANGSKVTFTVGTNDASVRIAQGDTADLQAGAYDCEVLVIDGSETAPADAAKHAEMGVVVLYGTPGGDLTDEQSSGSSSSSESS